MTSSRLHGAVRLANELPPATGDSKISATTMTFPARLIRRSIRANSPRVELPGLDILLTAVFAESVGGGSTNA